MILKHVSSVFMPCDVCSGTRVQGSGISALGRGKERFLLDKPMFWLWTDGTLPEDIP